mmetsp:Transcript_27030/g.88389  ORF Transcript_27030/g.88389 Transcript_27030/m.88389 type:complete len:266 (+) Transcript_27030:466-1263(+)
MSSMMTSSRSRLVMSRRERAACTDLPERFMKVVGFSRWTLRPLIMTHPRSPWTSATGFMVTCHLLASSSTARKPMLCLVCVYCDPGLPSPTTRTGSLSTESLPGVPQASIVFDSFAILASVEDEEKEERQTGGRRCLDDSENTLLVVFKLIFLVSFPFTFEIPQDAFSDVAARPLRPQACGPGTPAASPAAPAADTLPERPETIHADVSESETALVAGKGPSSGRDLAAMKAAEDAVRLLTILPALCLPIDGILTAAPPAPTQPT